MPFCFANFWDSGLYRNKNNVTISVLCLIEDNAYAVCLLILYRHLRSSKKIAQGRAALNAHRIFISGLNPGAGHYGG
jgi:hypothetical protein